MLMHKVSRCLVAVCLLLAGSASARDSLAAFPLDILSTKVPVDSAEKANLERVFPIIVRAVAASPTSAQLARASSGAAQKDCGRKDECLAQFAKQAGALYGFYAVLIVDTDGTVAASGRVVKNDGQLVLGPKVGAKIGMGDGFTVAATEAIRSLISELDIALITSPAQGCNLTVDMAHKSMVLSLDQIGREATFHGGWRLDRFLRTELVLATAIESARTPQECDEWFRKIDALYAGLYLSTDIPLSGARPFVAAYPLDVSRIPKKFPGKEVAETSRLLPHLVHIAARGVSSAQIERAAKAGGQSDCGMKNDCLARFAESTDSLYALQATLAVDAEGMLTASGKIVRRDGRVMAGPMTSEKQKIDNGLPAAASEALVSLIRELGVGGLPSVIPAAKFEEVGREPTEAWRKLRRAELDELGEGVASRSQRFLRVFAKTEPALVAAIERASSRNDTLNVVLRFRALRAELGKNELSCSPSDAWKQAKLENVHGLLDAAGKQRVKTQEWVAAQTTTIAKMIHDAVSVDDCRAVNEEVALTEIELGVQ